MVVVSLYYLFVCIVLLLIMVSFLFWGVRLYKNLIGFENVNPIVKERVKRVTDSSESTNLFRSLLLLLARQYYRYLPLYGLAVDIY